MNIESLIQPHVRRMHAYTPIVPIEVLSQKLGIPAEQIVKLDANENVYGPAPSALVAMAHAHNLHIYPDPDQTELRTAISEYIGVPKEHILCGAGADELIQLIGMAFVAPGQAIVDLPPTFGMYKWLADIVAAQYLPVPRHIDFSLRLNAIESAIKNTPHAKLLFVTNPNNPDGSTIDDETLLQLLALPVVVVLDEAYIDFASQAHPSRAHWVAQHENLIVLRTFSKLLGMAGMRIGYGIFPLPVAKHLWKLKQPYTPTVASAVGAIAALQEHTHLRDQVQRIVNERERMAHALRSLGWLHVLPSQTNFLLCHVNADRPDLGDFSGLTVGQRVKIYLEQRGILVRYFDKDGLRDCFRVSVGKPEHTDRLLEALRALQDDKR
jgi:histidinol-phosphate aminotransferase